MVVAGVEGESGRKVGWEEKTLRRESGRRSRPYRAVPLKAGGRGTVGEEGGRSTKEILPLETNSIETALYAAKGSGTTKVQGHGQGIKFMLGAHGTSGWYHDFSRICLSFMLQGLKQKEVLGWGPSGSLISDILTCGPINQLMSESPTPVAWRPWCEDSFAC